VLYACINFKRAMQDYSAIADALRAGELDKARDLIARWRGEPASEWSESEIARAAIEAAFVRAHRDLLAVIAWFVVLPGPAGVVLYKLSGILADKWGRRTDEEFGAFGRFSAKAFYVPDWVPLRLTAIGFAIAGDFEDAVACWRGQAQTWPDPATGVILASGAGALDVRLGGALPKEGGANYRPELGTGDDPDANYMHSAAGLIWRTLVIWMIVLVLLTLARWAGA
jgi:cobalamin biosynthesis protein CobD/CbiB